MTTLQRHRVALPVDGTLPRVGKIRLGTTTLNEKLTKAKGRNIYTPRKADHFVVDVDDSGITGPDAVQAFRERYGDQPKAIDCMLVGPTPDDNLEGAWRQYGTSKLKVRCDGVANCSVRRETGGWAEQPCLCLAKGQTGDERDCVLSYTLQLILPDVTGVGVWQLDTGSTISSRRMANWLTMMHNLRGDLRLFEFTLRLVPVKVDHAGQTSTVYVLDPQAPLASPREMLQAAARQAAGELPTGAAGGQPAAPTAALPPPAADDQPEPTVHRPDFDTDEGPDPTPAPVSGDPDPPAGGQVGGADADDPLESTKQQLRDMASTDQGKAYVRALGDLLGVAPRTVNRIATAALAKYGVDECADMDRLVDQLEAAGDIAID